MSPLILEETSVDELQQQFNTQAHSFFSDLAKSSHEHEQVSDKLLIRASDSICEQLRQLVGVHVEICKCMPHAQPQQLHDNVDHAHESLSKRQQIFEELTQQLDASACALGAVVDDIQDLLSTPHLNTPDPQEVIKYAHRVRYTTFSRAGAASLPPAPQPPQMQASTLYRFGQMFRAQQQQPLAAAAQPAQPIQPAQQQPVAPAPSAPAPAAPQAPTIFEPEAGQFPQGMLVHAGAPPPEWQPHAAMQQPEEESPDVERKALERQRQQEAAAVAAAAAGGNSSLADFILNPDMEEVLSDYDSDEDDDFM